MGYLDRITDANTNAVYWTANAMDAYGRPTQETAGNGVVTNRSFWPESGRIEQIETEAPGQPPGTLVGLSYNWDTIGNLVSRGDTINGVAENFCYLDNAGGTANVLNRLSNYSVGGDACTDGSLVETVTYDNGGNIQSKSDVGAYGYGQNGAGPHALTSIATNAGVLVDGVTCDSRCQASRSRWALRFGPEICHPLFTVPLFTALGSSPAGLTNLDPDLRQESA